MFHPHRLTCPRHPVPYYSSRCVSQYLTLDHLSSFRPPSLLLSFSGLSCSRKLVASVVAMPTPEYQDHTGQSALRSQDFPFQLSLILFPLPSYMYSLIYIRTHVIGNYSVKVRKAFPLIEFLPLQYDVPPFLSTRHVWDTEVLYIISFATFSRAASES